MQFWVGGIRQIVSDTMLMLKFVILLRLCLNATVTICWVFQSYQVLADAALLLLYTKLGADKLASKKLLSRKRGTSPLPRSFLLVTSATLQDNRPYSAFCHRQITYSYPPQYPSERTCEQWCACSIGSFFSFDLTVSIPAWAQAHSTGTTAPHNS